MPTAPGAKPPVTSDSTLRKNLRVPLLSGKDKSRLEGSNLNWRVANWADFLTASVRCKKPGAKAELAIMKPMCPDKDMTVLEIQAQIDKARAEGTQAPYQTPRWHTGKSGGLTIEPRALEAREVDIINRTYLYLRLVRDRNRVLTEERVASPAGQAVEAAPARAEAQDPC